MKSLNKTIITSNLDSQNLRNVGHTGFDVITLIGFNLPHKFEEPVIDHCFRKNNQWITELDKYGEICHTPRKVTISGYKLEKCIYKLSFGNQGTRAFMSLTIYSRIKHISDNVENLSVKDVWYYLKAINDDLYSKYGISLDYDECKLRIKEAEINKTFPINTIYKNYTRIFNLLSYIFSQSKKIAKKGSYSRIEKNGTTVETNYLFVGKTIKILAYNKGIDVSDKSGSPIPYNFDVDIMRMEIKCLEQSLINIVPNNSNKYLLLKDVNDELLTAFFYNFFAKIFNKSDEYLDTVFYSAPANLPETYNAIVSNILQEALRSHASSIATALLNDLFYKEQKSGTLLFLDIDDFIYYIKNCFEDKNSIEPLIDALNDIKNNPQMYHELCQCFIGQRELYNYLKDSLLYDRSHTLCFTNSYDNTPICFYLENPILYPWDASCGEELYITNNNIGLVYRLINEGVEESLPRFNRDTVTTQYLRKEFITFEEYAAYIKEYDIYIDKKLNEYEQTFIDEEHYK